MSVSVNTSTMSSLRRIAKSAVELGAITRQEYREVMQLLRDLQRDRAVKPGRKAALVPLKVAAERLSCGKRSVSRMLHDGRLTAVHLKPGSAKSLRVRETELDALCNPS